MMNEPPKPRHPEAPADGEEVMYVDLSREKLERFTEMNSDPEYGVFFYDLPKYCVVTGTNPQVSHVSGTALTEEVGRVSRPLVGMERIMGQR